MMVQMFISWNTLIWPPKSGVYSSTAGFGTFGARLSSGNVLLDFTPNVGTAVSTNTSIITLSDTGTGISSITFQESRLNSNYKSISASWITFDYNYSSV